jgi:hypothetical protein
VFRPGFDTELIVPARFGAKVRNVKLLNELWWVVALATVYRRTGASQAQTRLTEFIAITVALDRGASLIR